LDSKRQDHPYRKQACPDDLVCFRVIVKETDLWVSAERKLQKPTRDLVLSCRQQLESYIHAHPKFLTTLHPVHADPLAPPLVKDMIDATRPLGVGPMASVAGCIAQHVAQGLLAYTDQVIVENGGDIFMKTNRTVTVSLYAGGSPLSGRLGILVPEGQMPMGLCSSSATLGHSLSLGVADAVCVLSHSGAIADGAATALGNRIKSEKDMEETIRLFSQFKEIVGGVVIVEENLAAWGEIQMVDLS
jgi:ApbE superfamily uncharacterized protein (UPF0280 family)